MVHRVWMGSHNLLERMKQSPVARRIAMVALLAGLGVVAWFTVSRTPVESRLVIHLAGDWPALHSVRLAYFETESWDPMRQVRTFPGSEVRTIDDEPQLSPGAYRVEVTVDTAGGTRQFVRDMEHESGAETHIELRFEGD